MSLDGLLHLPRLNTDVSLGNSSTAVLEKLLHQGNVIVAVLIDLSGVVLPEAVGTDVPISTPTSPYSGESAIAPTPKESNTTTKTRLNLSISDPFLSESRRGSNVIVDKFDVLHKGFQ